jgi:hypothetical protein
MRETANHSERMDTDRDARVSRDPVRQIRINRCKKLACLHEHSGRMRAALTVQ